MRFTPLPGFHGWPWSKNGWVWLCMGRVRSRQRCWFWGGFIPVSGVVGRREHHIILKKTPIWPQNYGEKAESLIQGS